MPKLWTGEILKPWDGYDKNKRYLYKIDAGSRFKYYISAEGTIYYTIPEREDPYVWCPSGNLTTHLRRLMYMCKNTVEEVKTA